MDFGENNVEISPHGLARQPAKKRNLRKTKVATSSDDANRQVRRLDGQQQQQGGEEEKKLPGAMVDELRLHFDFESLKEG